MILLAAVLALLTIKQQPEDETAPGLVQSLKRSVVSIEAQGHYGTGFIASLKDDVATIVTARHVVEGSHTAKIGFFEGDTVSVPADDVQVALTGDMATMRVRVPARLVDQVRRAKFADNPLALLRRLADKGVRQPLITIGRGVVNNQVDAWLPQSGVARLRLSSEKTIVLEGLRGIVDGYSGAPIWLTAGLRTPQVIGMVVWERDYVEAIPAAALETILPGPPVGTLATGDTKPASWPELWTAIERLFDAADGGRVGLPSATIHEMAHLGVVTPEFRLAGPATAVPKTTGLWAIARALSIICGCSDQVAPIGVQGPTDPAQLNAAISFLARTRMLSTSDELLLGDASHLYRNTLRYGIDRLVATLKKRRSELAAVKRNDPHSMTAKCLIGMSYTLYEPCFVVGGPEANIPGDSEIVTSDQEAIKLDDSGGNSIVIDVNTRVKIDGPNTNGRRNVFVYHGRVNVAGSWHISTPSCRQISGLATDLQVDHDGQTYTHDGSVYAYYRSVDDQPILFDLQAARYSSARPMSSITATKRLVLDLFAFLQSTDDLSDRLDSISNMAGFCFYLSQDDYSAQSVVSEALASAGERFPADLGKSMSAEEFNYLFACLFSINIRSLTGDTPATEPFLIERFPVNPESASINAIYGDFHVKTIVKSWNVAKIRAMMID